MAQNPNNYLAICHPKMGDKALLAGRGMHGVEEGEIEKDCRANLRPGFKSY